MRDPGLREGSRSPNIYHHVELMPASEKASVTPPQPVCFLEWLEPFISKGRERILERIFRQQSVSLCTIGQPTSRPISVLSITIAVRQSATMAAPTKVDGT